MRYFGWLITVVGLILSPFTQAKGEPPPVPQEVPNHWEFYPAKVNHRPASIFLNIWYKDHLPIEKAPILYWCRIDIMKPTDHGMGAGDEALHLNALEDRLNKAAIKQGLYPVGRLRNEGIWQISYFGPKGKDLGEIASDVMHDEKHNYEVGESADPTWSYYTDFLFPEPERWQWIMDRRTVEAIESKGDPLTEARRVDHWIYCPTADSRNAVKSVLMEDGFVVEREWSVEDDVRGFPYALQIYRDDLVQLDHIHEVVMVLNKHADAAGADYDGWETVVLVPKDESSKTVGESSSE